VRTHPLLLTLCLLGAGCAGSAVLRAADSGDVDVLRKSLDARLKEGEVDADEARNIAERFMSRQIESADGTWAGLDGLASCAARFEGPLARRAELDDELAARAAMVRFEDGQLEPLAYARLLKSDEPHWRALAVRTLTLPEPEPGEASESDRAGLGRAGRWRRKLMTDLHTPVRRAALRAAADAADPHDAEAVLEAARLEPDRAARLDALRAAGAIGTRRTVLALADRWPRADEDERVAMVEAWTRTWRRSEEGCVESERSQAPCLAHERLWRTSQAGEGMASLYASLALLAGVAPDKADAHAGTAAAVVERTIDEGPARVREVAIAEAPLGWAHLLEAIVAAAKSPDDRVAAAALGRMTELGDKERKLALAKLRKLAKGEGVSAEAARRALVRARDRAVVPLLANDARAKSAQQRARAAERFGALGQVNETLALVADPNAHVRSRAVCALFEMDDG
jgi:hypothetical protein